MLPQKAGHLVDTGLGCAVALCQLDECRMMLAVDDDSLPRLFLLALGLRLAGIENWTGRIGNQRCARQAIQEAFEPSLEGGPLVDRVDRELFTSEGSAVPTSDAEASIAFVSSGVPVPNHDVIIVDDSGKEVPDRTEGFLWFRGPGATRGYFNNSEETEKLFPQGQAPEGEFAWVNSGDRAYRADGEIFVTGRVKDIIIKGGRNLYPHEVEELAGRAAGIRKGCIVAFGLKDGGTGTEKLIVVAESREGEPAAKSAIAAAVTEQISQGLGLPPDRVELIPPGSIPKTSSGKLRREETKQLYIAGTLSAKKAPAWVQIARLGASSATRTAGKSVVSGIHKLWDAVRGVYFICLFAAWIVPAWTIVLFFKDDRAAGRYTSAALKVLFALAGSKVRVVGKEYMDSPGAKIYVSNHTSYFDVLPLMLGLGVPYRFVAKKEVHGFPFIGTFLRKMGHLSFDRTANASRREAAQNIGDAIRAGDSVFIFPEGTFVPEPGVRPFQLGAFKAAVDTGAPLIPVSLAGTRDFLRDGKLLPTPSDITITLSPPIYPQRAGKSQTENWQELVRLRDASREAIAKHSGEPLL